VRGAAQRRRGFRLGLSGERRAAWLLRLKGYKVLAFRYKTPGGEADLVVRRGSTLVFVEVKVRASFEAGLAAINLRQQWRVAAAARAWLAHHPASMALTVRFDAVLLAPGRWPRHLVGAFERDV